MQTDFIDGIMPSPVIVLIAVIVIICTWWFYRTQSIGTPELRKKYTITNTVLGR